MELGATRQLESDDLWLLERANEATDASDRLAATYQAHAGASSRLLRAVVTAYGPGVALCGPSSLFSAACSLLAPVVLNRVIASLEAPELGMRSLTWWLGAFFASRVADALLSAQAAYYVGLIGILATASLRMLLFRKVNNLWIVPMQLIAVIYMLYWVLGAASFPGLVLVFLPMGATYVVSKYQLTFFAEMMRYHDARVKAVQEVFGAIQTVKFSAWEDKFADRIAGVRAEELRVLRKFLVVAATETFAVWATPLLVSIASFAVYMFVLERSLTVATVFMAIALFNGLRCPLQDFPGVVQIALMSTVSLDRMDQHLALPEYATDNVEALSDGVQENVAVLVEYASFSWDADSSSPLVLQGVDFCVMKGDLAVIHGDVGAGKSALCLALLGELEKRQGCVGVRGRVAYYSQQPWIENRSVRDNILFGNALDSERYRRVLDACGLLPDSEQLPAGDATEIGQNGVNLLGGQKARASLARACYSDADVFILDSPLAAVDARVKSEIFSKCFDSLLRTKTLILVTHNPLAIDSDVVNVKIHVSNGAVSVSRRSEATARGASSALTFSLEAAGESPSLPSLPSEQQSGRLVQEERREQGRVSKRVFWVYLRSLGGLKMSLLVLLTQLLWQGFQISSDVWLTHWTSAVAAPIDSESYARDMAVYAALGSAAVVMVFVQSVTVMLVGVRGARHLLTRALLRAPMRFFDANPIGRITNRYSADVSAVDFRMPLSFGIFIGDVVATVCQLATAAYAINLLGALVLPLAWAYVRAADFYLDSSREVNRLQKVAVSPCSAS